MSEIKKRVILEWFGIAGGFLVVSFGVFLTIFANIGLAPWDCLSMGIAKHTPLNYGLSMTMISAIVLVVDLILKEKIGFGTIIDVFLAGNFVQMYSNLNPFPLNTNFAAGVIILVIGMAFIAVGMRVYMSCAQCCGSRDALLLGLGRRLHNMPIGFVEIILWGLVLFAGWLLGGKVGIGTLITTLAGGTVMQMIYTPLRFEPRNIRHKSLFEVITILKEG